MFIDTTDKKNSNEHRTYHQNFKNHSQQIILYSYNPYFGVIALTLVSNTVLHRFASPLRNALCSSTVTIFLHSVVNTRCQLYATHYLTVRRRLSISCCLLFLYSSYRISGTFYTILRSTGYP